MNHYINVTLDNMGFTRYHLLLFLTNALFLFCEGMNEIIHIILLSMIDEKHDLSHYHLAFMNSIEYLGYSVSTLLVNYITTLIKRKHAILISVFVSVLCTGLSITSFNFIFASINRFILGFCFGILDILIYLNLFESLPTKIRGFISTMILLFFPLGEFCLSLMCYFKLKEGEMEVNYKFMLLFPFIFTCIICLSAIFLQESPRELFFGKQNYEKYNLEEIWKVIIEAYDMIFRQRDSVFKNMKKSHKELVSKSSSEMKISIINFIVNILLPNSLHINKQMQIRLLILLDIGSSLENESNNESSGSVTSSISKVCISNLFELCKFKTPEVLKREINVQNFNPDDYVKIKEKIAKMCTPILIKRCKEILKKFLADEIKSGSMPLSRSRLEDIKYVLEKLKKLEIYPDYNKIEDIRGKKEIKMEENDQQEIIGFILKKKKSHLISLLPLLSEFITTKENEIKILVKDIFKIISAELGIK